MWAALLLLPPSLAYIWLWASEKISVNVFWWLPTDAILVLGFTSDPHVNEPSVQRICVFRQHIYEMCLFSFEC